MTYDHIEGLTGREPVGAILRIGRKGDAGQPIENDRFFFVSPQPERKTIKRGGGEASIQFRQLHPDFGMFNDMPAESRRSLKVNLVHSAHQDAYLAHLRAQQLAPATKYPPHPNGAPACVGDGEKATRYYGLTEDGEHDFREIDCPNDLCEFRQEGNRRCAPFARLYFRPHWKGESPLPTPLTKLTTRSWNSAANLKGFFEYVSEQAEQLGIERGRLNLFGLPLTIHLGRKTKRDKGHSFPVLTFTPEIDLIAFFARQRKALDEAGATPRQIVGAQSEEETADEVVTADFQDVTAPQMPGDGTLFELEETP
jgi:hypothetical protein